MILMNARFANHGAKSADLHGVQLPVIKKFAHCHAVVILGATKYMNMVGAKDLTLDNVYINMFLFFVQTCFISPSLHTDTQ